jgi:hypothetical protein
VVRADTSRTWSQLRNESLSIILTHTLTDDLVDHADELMGEVKTNFAQLTCHNVLLLFRRLIVLHLRTAGVDLDRLASRFLDLLLEFISLQEEEDENALRQSKHAIANLLSSLIPSIGFSDNVLIRFLERAVPF